MILISYSEIRVLLGSWKLLIMATTHMYAQCRGKLNDTNPDLHEWLVPGALRFLKAMWLMC